MKLSQIAPMRWYHQVNLWTMNLSPWRYAALMASGIASGSALWQWLAGTDRSLAERFLAAARAAGIEARVTAHSGRVGRASELTARGASTTEVMLAGQLENRPHGRSLLGRRDRRTRGRQKVFVKAGTGGRHDSTTASIEHHSGMNSRWRVTGSRTSKPHQNHIKTTALRRISWAASAQSLV